MDIKGWASNLASRGQQLAREGLTYVNQQINEKQQLHGLSFSSLTSSSSSSATLKEFQQEQHHHQHKKEVSTEQQQKKTEKGPKTHQYGEEEEEKHSKKQKKKQREQTQEQQQHYASWDNGSADASDDCYDVTSTSVRGREKQQHFDSAVAAQRSENKGINQRRGGNRIPAVLRPSSLVYYIVQQEAFPPPFSQIYPVRVVHHVHENSSKEAVLVDSTTVRTNRLSSSSAATPATIEKNNRTFLNTNGAASTNGVYESSFCQTYERASTFQWNAFLLPAGIPCDCVSLQLFHKLFPLHGSSSFVFRFKVSSPLCPGGYVWQDCASYENGAKEDNSTANSVEKSYLLPCYKGKLVCKALQLPAGVHTKRLAPHCRAALVAAVHHEVIASRKQKNRQSTALAEVACEKNNEAHDEEGRSMEFDFKKLSFEKSRFFRNSAASAACDAAVAAVEQAAAALPQLFGKRTSSKKQTPQASESNIAAAVAGDDHDDGEGTSYYEKNILASSPSSPHPQQISHSVVDARQKTVSKKSKETERKEVDEEEEKEEEEEEDLIERKKTLRKKKAASLPGAPDRRGGRTCGPSCRPAGTDSASASPSLKSSAAVAASTEEYYCSSAASSSSSSGASSSSLLVSERKASVIVDATSPTSLLFEDKHVTEKSTSSIGAVSASSPWPDILGDPTDVDGVTSSNFSSSSNNRSNVFSAAPRRGHLSNNTDDLFFVEGRTETQNNHRGGGLCTTVTDGGAEQGSQPPQARTRNNGNNLNADSEDFRGSETTFIVFREGAKESSNSAELLSREQLAAGRRARTEQRMREKLQETEEWRQSELARRQDFLNVSEEVRQQLTKWAKGSDGCYKDIRTLLCSVHEVLWEGAEWEEVSISTLMISHQVKRYYRKALLLTHPDKHQTGSAEQLYRAEKIFQAFNEAYRKHPL